MRISLCKSAAHPRTIVLGFVLCLSFVLPGVLCAQSQPAARIPERSVHDWVMLAVNNQAEAITHEGSYLRYKTHAIDAKGDRTRDVVESKDGTVARTIARNGKPLDPDEDSAERKRLEGMAASPEAFARHMKNDASGRKLAVELIRQLPDAMIFTPATGLADARSPSGGRLIVFDFQPNPDWKPPTTSSEALTGIRGRVWIDAGSGFVTRIDAEVFRSVNLGWGVLAHIYPGGKMTLQQTNPAPNRWIYSHFSDSAKVRALMLKTIDISSDVTASDFQLIGVPLTYQQAIALLLRGPSSR